MENEKKRDDKPEEKIDSISAFFFTAANLMNQSETKSGRKEGSIMRSLILRQKMALIMIEQKTRTQPQGISLNSIAQMLNIPHSSASLLIESLVKKGLCQRVTNPSNRRKVNISLSDFGKKMLKKIIKKTETTFHELQEGIPPEEIAIFEKVIFCYYKKLFTK